MKFNWLYVGSGMICKTTARQIVKDGHVIKAVCARNAKTGAKLAKKYGAEYYSDLAEAIRHGGYDGAYIGTVHTVHCEEAIACIEAGIPVLIEKPIAVNASDAKKLFALAEERGVYCAEAMWTWFSPVAQKVKSWIEDGEIGKSFRGALIKYGMATTLYYKADRLLNPNKAGGALLDVGIYPIAYCCKLYGKPNKVNCVSVLNKDGVDLSDKITLSYGKEQCFIDLSLTKLLGESAMFIGNDGVIEVPFFHFASKAKLLKRDDSEIFKAKTNYVNEFNAVASEILSGKKQSEIYTPQDVIGVMEILDECRRQGGVVYPFEKGLEQ